MVCKTCLWFMCLHLMWTSYIQWPWDQRAERHLHADAFVLHIFSNAIKQYFQYGLRVQILFMHVHLPLWDMPTARHLWKRQYWHLFLFFFWILHFRAHLSYSSLSRMVLLKNPCEIYILNIYILNNNPLWNTYKMHPLSWDCYWNYNVNIKLWTLIQIESGTSEHYTL